MTDKRTLGRRAAPDVQLHGAVSPNLLLLSQPTSCRSHRSGPASGPANPVALDFSKIFAPKQAETRRPPGRCRNFPSLPAGPDRQPFP